MAAAAAIPARDTREQKDQASHWTPVVCQDEAPVLGEKPSSCRACFELAGSLGLDYDRTEDKGQGIFKWVIHPLVLCCNMKANILQKGGVKVMFAPYHSVKIRPRF